VDSSSSTSSTRRVASGEWTVPPPQVLILSVGVSLTPAYPFDIVKRFLWRRV
jgi:hypothetical protein